MPQCEKTDSIGEVLRDLTFVGEILKLTRQAETVVSPIINDRLAEIVEQLCARLDHLDFESRCDDAVRPRRKKADTDMVDF